MSGIVTLRNALHLASARGLLSLLRSKQNAGQGATALFGKQLNIAHPEGWRERPDEAPATITLIARPQVDAVLRGEVVT
jgi:hypothetical protein